MEIMDTKGIFAAILGLSAPWQVTDISYTHNFERLDIYIDYTRDDVLVCPRCGSRKPCIKKKLCTWYSNDFFSYETYLHARIPQMICCEQETVIMPPWFKLGSKFIQV